MSDLVAWLRAQLDEDERLANEAANAPPIQFFLARQAGKEISSRFLHAHSPARVLAEVEAKRRILDVHEHSPKAEVVWIEQKPGPQISRSGDITTTMWPTAVEPGRWQETGRTLYGCDQCESDSHYDIEYRGWCETVRLLAQPYADRPGYDEAWRP